jgi:glycosyltransferase involved in cell wall biosynthesis
MAIKLLFVQPILTSYRVPLFEDLAEQCESVTVMAAMASADFGVDEKKYKFNFVKVNWKSLCGLMSFSIFKYMKLVKAHSHLIHFGDFKYLTLYYSICAKFLFGTRFFVHGQGGYKKNGLLKNIAYRLLITLSDGYIAYNEYAADKLKDKLPRKLHHKVSFVKNSLYLNPVTAINTAPKLEVAYIGRLRQGSNIEMLADACKAANLKLNVVGLASIDEQKNLLKHHTDIVFHGALFDEDAIKLALKDCLAGVYAGDAGLSVVHYMALGLPVIVHSDIDQHMGPEPAYIKNGLNGLMFERGELNSLIVVLKNISLDLLVRNKIAENSLIFFQRQMEFRMGQMFVENICRKYD